MRTLNWRTTNNGAYYVHSILGDDNTGDGSKTKPFKTLKYAINYIPTKTYFVCIGYFSEQLSDIPQKGISIIADYVGAATFDGKNKYIIPYALLNGMIVKNVPASTINTPISGDEQWKLTLGVGSISFTFPYYEYTNGMGNHNIIHKCNLIFGVIGGRNEGYNVYSKIIKNSQNGVILMVKTTTGFALVNNTVYDIPLNIRDYNTRNKYIGIAYRWIFAKFAMLANDYDQKFTECLFTADTTWHLDLNGTDVITYADMDDVIESGYASDRGEAIIYIMQHTYNITDAKRLPTFTDCIFTDLTSEQIFNDPENVDFTLKYFQGNPAIISDNVYLGALPPALHISIKANSDGQTFCFDNRTLDGCLSIDANNILNINTSSASGTGHIYSKVITINPTQLQISGIFSFTENHLTTQKAVMNINRPWTQQYGASDLLPIGKYLIVGEGIIAYNNINYVGGESFSVEAENTQYVIVDGNPTVYYIEETNVGNVVYVRTQQAIYKHLLANEQLESGGYYINDSNNTMVYDGRTIQPHESFIADSGLSFTAADNQVGILFDDTRVPDSEWIPSDAWGDYFVWRQNGTIKKDSYGIPISSGNSRSFINSSNGGYSNTLVKSILKERFVQFGIFVNKI